MELLWGFWLVEGEVGAELHSLGVVVEVAGVELPAVLGGALMVERGPVLPSGRGAQQGDAAGAEFAHPVADYFIGALTEFLGFQAGDGVVVDDAAELLGGEDDEVDVGYGWWRAGRGMEDRGEGEWLSRTCLPLCHPVVDVVVSGEFVILGRMVGDGGFEVAVGDAG